MMKIAALGGSLRPQSLTYCALNLALKKIEAQGVSTNLIDLRKLHLPFCNGEPFYPNYPDVAVLRQSVQSANGLLLATPEYHGDISGVLKNAIDLLENEHITGKVVGLMAVVGGAHSTHAINTMRLVCRQLHCWVIPEQVIIPYSEESFDAQGEFKDSQLDERLERMIGHLIAATRKLGPEHLN
jgi:FMN reductase